MVAVASVEGLHYLRETGGPGEKHDLSCHISHRDGNTVTHLDETDFPIQSVIINWQNKCSASISDGRKNLPKFCPNVCNPFSQM